MRRSLLALLAIVGFVAGCTGPEPSAPPATTEGPRAIGGEIQLSCGGGSGFGIELVSIPGDAEHATDDVGPFLRAATASGALPDGTTVPATGWHRISKDNSTAEFLNFGVDPPAYLEFWRTGGGGWDLQSSGSCVPGVVVPDGGFAATWELDPTALGPDARSTSFAALVSAPACASGQRQDLRLVDPTVQLLDDRVYVLFAVEPLGGDGQCPGDPPASVTVELGEPLSDRELVDPTTLFPSG